MSDRVTMNEATKMLDMCKSTVRMAADNRGWVSTYEGKTKKRTFLRSDIEALAAERKENYTPIKYDRQNKADETREHVEWADSLTKWPSDEEFEARVSDVYRRKDLEGLLDTRVFRFKDVTKALRQPAMSLDDHRRT